MRAGSKELILAYLEACPDTTSTEIATATGISRETVRRNLRVLYKERKVNYTEDIRKSRGNRYRLASAVQAPPETAKKYAEPAPAPLTKEEAERVEEKARLRKEWLAYRKQRWGYR